MHKTTPTLLGLGAMAVLGLSAITSLLSPSTLQGAVNTSCIGQPYGTAGCPEKAASSAGIASNCGNGVLDTGEECDLGSQRNGFSNCTKTCEALFCGDGLISPPLKEECEPLVEEVYALNEQKNDLVLEIRYISPTCGSLCTVPTCDSDGDCTGGCQHAFLPACQDGEEEVVHTAAQSSADTQAIALVQSSSGGVSETESNIEFGMDEGSTDESTSCMNGVVDAGEQCDDGNQNNTDACSNICRIAVCGDGIPQLWEQCDDGNRVDIDSCSNICKSPACGDGFTQSGEECDDGNQSNIDACMDTCRLPRCGDRLVQSNEECDDGNQNNGDACTNSCALPHCGDGIVQLGEQCDDGNMFNGDACTSLCVGARCGDGMLQQLEECDDGNRVSNDGCNTMCKLPVCGNGVREGEEQCDDTNRVNEDACTNECKKSTCGDGFIHKGEFCDDGNLNNEDTCTVVCRPPTCGDGIVQLREECDNGRQNSDTNSAACRTDCRNAHCGDNTIDPNEECDGGDTCTAACKNKEVIAAAPSMINWSQILSTILGAFGITFVTAYIFRKQFHGLIAGIAGDNVATSIDDIPLDEIEMPWHKW